MKGWLEKWWDVLVFANCRCSKFPQESRLKKFVHSVMEVFSHTPEKEEAMSKEEQTEAQSKRDLFSLLPAHCRKALLVQASGGCAGARVEGGGGHFLGGGFRNFFLVYS